jgi:SAM-dependent methyltransferase
MADDSSTPTADPYTAGMDRWSEDMAGAMPDLDRFHFDLLAPHLGPRTLEIGAGDGRVTSLVAASERVTRYVVAEPSGHFARLLHKRYGDNPRVELLQSDTKRMLPAHASSFDCVFSIHVMEHIEDDRGFVRECLELTRDGGHVVIQVPAGQFLYSNLDRQIGHFRRYDKRRIRGLVSGLDCELKSLRYSNLLGVLVSLVFIKVLKLGYAANEGEARRFFSLYRLYSRTVIPVVTALERAVPVPFGLNLTAVLEKKAQRRAS